LSWREAFGIPTQASEPPAPAPSVDASPRPLHISELLAAVRVLRCDGDGTIPVTSWEPDEDGPKGRWHHVTRDVRILSPGQADEIRAVGTLAASTQVDVRSAGDGWLAVTDPETGDVQACVRMIDIDEATILARYGRRTGRGGR
jgi:hypothetical protein